MTEKKAFKNINAAQYAQAMELITALMYGQLIKAVMPKVDVVLLERKEVK